MSITCESHSGPRSTSDATGRGARLGGAALALALILTAQPTPASELVYQPVNPSFGGNPFNSSHLLGIANAQNGFEDPDSAFGSSAGLSQGELFVRSLQSRLLSALAGQVSDAIFGPDPKDSGTIIFGEQTISFNRGLEFISIEIFDAATGETTLVQVPVLLP